MGKKAVVNWLCALAILALLASACTAETPPLPAATATLTEIVRTATAPVTVEVAFTNTPAPTPTDIPRTLTICTGDEPYKLYIYDGAMYISNSVLEAVYDGPIDSVGYSYQPVILAKLPSLADGDAVIRPVAVEPGGLLIDAADQVSTLHEGVSYRPSGCRSRDCEQIYSGSESVILDQMTVTFTLKTGITWSDGQPLTSLDSLYSYRLDSATETPSSKYKTERTEAYTPEGPNTIVWTGRPGFIDQTYFLNFWHPLPEHVWSEYSAAELLEAEVSRVKPMGWGPYIIEEWVNGSHIRLRRNPNYFRAGEGLPHFDYLIFRFIGENAARAVSYLVNGTCDVANVTTHMDILLQDLVQLDGEGNLQLHTTSGTVFEHLAFGLAPVDYDDGYQPGADRPDFFGDLRTRQAFAFCLDRQRLVDEIYSGRSEVMPSYIPIGHPLFNAEAAAYRYDTEAGRALLEEVGWIDHDDDKFTPRISDGIPRVPDGTPFSVRFLTSTATQRFQAAQIIKQSLENCGIEALIETREPGELFADGPDAPLFGRQFELAMFAWLTDVTPPCDLWLTEMIPGESENHPAGWGGPNAGGYASPEFDAACRSALMALPGEPGYVENHMLAQEIFARDVPVIPLYLRILISAARPDFSGLIMDPTAGNEMWNIEEFDYND